MMPVSMLYSPSLRIQDADVAGVDVHLKRFSDARYASGCNESHGHDDRIHPASSCASRLRSAIDRKMDLSNPDDICQLRFVA